MISFDQVLLLQKKVESAVQKIVELKSENDALRSKCSELTNALSEKTELLENFYADEKKIESSIMNALDRLNSIENSVVSQGGQKEPDSVSEDTQDTQSGSSTLFDSADSSESPKFEDNPDSDSQEEKFDIF
ncbi:MAG: cell division protein ZapB [Treponema sp.]